MWIGFGQVIVVGIVVEGEWLSRQGAVGIEYPDLQAHVEQIHTRQNARRAGRRSRCHSEIRNRLIEDERRPVAVPSRQSPSADCVDAVEASRQTSTQPPSSVATRGRPSVVTRRRLVFGADVLAQLREELRMCDGLQADLQVQVAKVPLSSTTTLASIGWPPFEGAELEFFAQISLTSCDLRPHAAIAGFRPTTAEKLPPATAVFGIGTRNAELAADDVPIDVENLSSISVAPFTRVPYDVPPSGRALKRRDSATWWRTEGRTMRMASIRTCRRPHSISGFDHQFMRHLLSDVVPPQIAH